MNKDKKTLYIAVALLLGALLLVLFVPNGPWRTGTLAAVAAVAFVATWLLIKKRSILELEKKQIVYFLPVIGVIVLLAYYLLGFALGFASTGLGVSFLWRYLLPFALIIACSEYVRMVFLAQKNKRVLILTFLAMVLLDMAMLQQGSVFGDFYSFVDFMGMVFFPAITANLLYHYISIKYGMLPVALYKFILCAYPYFMPFTPILPSAMHAFLRILLPLAVLSFIRLLYERRKFVVSRQRAWLRTTLTAVAVLLMGMIIMLISCKFKYGLLVIATDSMSGTLDVGDAIIYCEYDGEVIEEGQIIVYEKNGLTVIHRVIKIENINGELRYYTQGDAMDNPDSGYVTKKDIVGTTDVTIKYIGHPTLWMRRLMR